LLVLDLDPAIALVDDHHAGRPGRLELAVERVRVVERVDRVSPSRPTQVNFSRTKISCVSSSVA
jgi:hypothetical protein